MILLQRKVDYNKHCLHYTGEYVLAHDDQTIKNNTNVRAIDCIYLRLAYTTTSNHEFYKVNTKKIILQRHCTSIPTPAHIINQIELQAKEENIPTGINFHSNKIQNVDLLFAGVDDK